MRRASAILRELAVVAVLAIAISAVAADRYVASLADGKQLAATRFVTWPVPGSPSRWGDQDLLTSANPARLVRDREAAGTTLRPPYLLLANGDVLTGSSVELDRDLSAGHDVPRVNVRLDGLMPLSGTGVAVRTDRIARIVGSPEAALGEEPPPGTVELADGRRFVARSIKWREQGLALLTAEGIVEAGFGEIVDAVFPDIDRTAAVQDDNLYAAGTSAGTIARYQLTSGAVVTASRISREQEPRSRRRGRSIASEPAIWYYAQPAWAEQPLAMPERDIAWCGLRSADQAPLALLPAELTASKRIIGSGAVWQRCSAGGQVAASGDIESDVAICTRAHSELTFALPPGARSFSAAVGLDRAVGSGGCVRCLVVADSAGGRTLWDSGILVGSDGPKLTGPIDVQGIERLVLIVEAAHEDRPPGADPLDIRDQVCWLCPLVQVEVDRTERLPAVLAGLASWQLAGSGLDDASISSEWNPRTLAWDPVLSLPKEQGLLLKRKLQVTAGGDVLELRTACPDNLEEHEFELTVNGKQVGWYTNTNRSDLRKWLQSYGRDRLRAENETAAMTDRLAYWWDLKPWRGQEVALELSIGGTRDRNDIAWRGLALRSAALNLAPGGRPLAYDVPLTSLVPTNQRAVNDRMVPIKNLLPGGRNDDRTIRFLGQPFTNGYSMMRDSSISFRLQPEYRRFVAIVGCANQVAGPLRVLIDDQIAWERKVAVGLYPAEQIDLAIPTGAKSLTLQVGTEGPYYGYAAWTEAGFVK